MRRFSPLVVMAIILSMAALACAPSIELAGVPANQVYKVTWPHPGKVLIRGWNDGVLYVDLPEGARDISTEISDVGMYGTMPTVSFLDPYGVKHTWSFARFQLEGVKGGMWIPGKVIRKVVACSGGCSRIQQP